MEAWCVGGNHSLSQSAQVEPYLSRAVDERILRPAKCVLSLPPRPHAVISSPFSLALPLDKRAWREYGCSTCARTCKQTWTVPMVTFVPA